MKFSTLLTMKQRVVMGCLCAGTLAAVACADGRGSPTSPSAETESPTRSKHERGRHVVGGVLSTKRELPVNEGVLNVHGPSR